MWKNNDRIIDFCCLNCSMARYNERLHCIAGVLPTCYKRKAATYFYPPGGTGLLTNRKNVAELSSCSIIDRTGAQTMLYLTCTAISCVDLAQYGVSLAKDWE